ncbi:MAG: hypothetical protein RDU25_01340 [Patescibacteria group bacterium]|nr:hypothetical protein [Patescibacteria group bacterium]
MENLFKVGGGLMWAVLGKIACKLPADLVGDLNDDPKMIEAMVKSAIEYRVAKLAEAEKNHYEMTVEEQIAALRRANEEESASNPHWVRIPEEDFARLASTAPAWPKGKHAYRSFRIRFGEGDEGVAKTFEAHNTRIQHVFGESNYWRWEHLHSGSVPFKGKPVERLRLLNGNHTHRPVIEWIVADLDAHRKRDSLTAVRGPKSLADELLVFAWLFPDMIRAIDYDKNPGLFAAGYEVNTPECGDESWRGVVIVSFDRDARRVNVYAYGRGRSGSDYSVPALREFKAHGA